MIINIEGSSELVMLACFNVIIHCFLVIYSPQLK